MPALALSFFVFMTEQPIDQPRLASAEQILDVKVQLDHLLLDMKARSANGKEASGRYKKHDTARLSYINTVALPGLRWGKLPPLQDMKMLFLPGVPA